MRRWSQTAAALAAIALVAVGAATVWIAFPYHAEEPLVLPLARVTETELSMSATSAHGVDLPSLMAAFQPQPHRSFCGPATLATILRANGRAAPNEWALFESVAGGIRTFYRGMSLQELRDLAVAKGLHSELVRADDFTAESFRERLKQNLAHAGDYVIINYDRRALNQTGAGHISAVASYDPRRDAFLVLDEATYRYPWTWVPTRNLYEAIRTLDGAAYRGVLFVDANHGASAPH